MKLKKKEDYRKRRHARLRRKIEGTASRPRMCVHVSNSHVYVQFIDDVNGNTLATASSMSKDIGKMTDGTKVEMAQVVGRKAAETARGQGIEEVVFDRGGFTYGGRIKALAEAAREAGLKF